MCYAASVRSLIQPDSIVRAASAHKRRPVFLHWTVFPFVSAYIAIFGILLSENVRQELQEVVFGWNNTAPTEPVATGSSADPAESMLASLNLTHVSLALAVVGFLHVVSLLLSYWRVGVKCFVQYQSCSVEAATAIRVIPQQHKGAEELCVLKSDSEDLCFVFQMRKYVYDDSNGQFRKAEYPVSRPLDQYLLTNGMAEGPDLATAQKRFGTNVLSIPVPLFQDLFKEHALAPFFVFQVFSVSLWCLDEMWFYSIVTLVMLAFMEVLVVKQRLRNMNDLRETISSTPRPVYVFRNRKWVQVAGSEIVPADIISIAGSAEPVVCPCDAILLAGTAIVNESVLTGESVPQMKEAITVTMTESPSEGFPSLDIRRDRRHCFFAGTLVVQHTGEKMTPPSVGDNAKSLKTIPKPPDGGCICSVLTTGFGTTQGSLVRTILFSSERVTASTLETGLFLLLLLVFALAAAAYVLDRGLKEGRSTWKLVLMCAQIITSVVPPELPIELSLAVNQSLIALGKLSVFCTEPFRIPFAGKVGEYVMRPINANVMISRTMPQVSACCFDKTGTLTSDELILRGIVQLTGTEPDAKMALPSAFSDDVVFAIAGCHDLSSAAEGGKDITIGDPLEKATLEAVEFHVSKSGYTVSRKSPKRVVRIVRQFHFVSALRRMSTICVLEHLGSSGEHALCCVKGAPEAVAPLLRKIPPGYTNCHEAQAAQGFRVLALASKPIHGSSTPLLRKMDRNDIESDLTFLGFLIYDCPLKPDAREVISSLSASCRLAIITGDHMLSAQEMEVTWKLLPQDPLEHANGEEISTKPAPSTQQLAQSYDLCVPGTILDAMAPGEAEKEDMSIASGSAPDSPGSDEQMQDISSVTTTVSLSAMLPHVKIFARTSPEHKELIISSLKGANTVTLMCGDGTNDTGALGQADVGVALLSSGQVTPPKKSVHPAVGSGSAEKPIRPAGHKGRSMEHEHHPRHARQKAKNKPRKKGGLAGLMETMKQAQERAAQGQKPVDPSQSLADEQPPSLKPGDACIAAPFTSKKGDLSSVLEIVRQGRCTLATTLQMYRILCVNCLVSAYSLSVMYLDGLKMGDFQMGAEGIILALCFFFISRAKPAPLSDRRPNPNIFSIAMMLSIFGQFCVHLAVLIYTQQLAIDHSPPSDEDGPIDLDADFSPTLVNTAVFMISLSMQLATFVVNYAGRPHMEDLSENRPLMYSLIAVSLAAAVLSIQIFHPLNVWLELVPMSWEFRMNLIGLEVGDFVIVWLWQLLLRRWL